MAASHGAPRQAVYTVLVDSRDRDYSAYPGADAYVLYLPRTYHQVTGLQLHSMELALSFYDFTAERGNTQAVASVYASPSPAPGDAPLAQAAIAVPDGNYTPDLLATALQAQLDGAFAAQGLTFAAAVDASSGLLAVQCVQGNAVALDSTPYQTGNPACWGLTYYLGLPKGLAGPSAALVGSRPLIVKSERYLLLDVAGADNVDECTLYGTGGPGTACAKIPLSGSGGYAWASLFLGPLDLAPAARMIAPPIARLDRLRVRLRYHDGSPVRFNGGEHSFVLHVTASASAGGP